MVNRVREVVLRGGVKSATSGIDTPSQGQAKSHAGLEESLVKRVVRQKFLSWNAASAGQIEVIEYLEELIDLTKLLVGAQEFRSGMLTRPTYRDYVNRIGKEAPEEVGEYSKEQETATTSDAVQQRIMANQVPTLQDPVLGLTKRRSTMLRNEPARKAEEPTTKPAVEDELPKPLQRVRTRRLEKQLSHQQ